MAALPVPTNRAAAINKARKRPLTIKIASTVQVAVNRIAKNAKKKDTVAPHLSQPLLQSNELE